MMIIESAKIGDRSSRDVRDFALTVVVPSVAYGILRDFAALFRDCIS